MRQLAERFRSAALKFHVKSGDVMALLDPLSVFYKCVSNTVKILGLSFVLFNLFVQLILNYFIQCELIICHRYLSMFVIILLIAVCSVVCVMIIQNSKYIFVQNTVCPFYARLSGFIALVIYTSIIFMQLFVSLVKLNS